MTINHDRARQLIHDPAATATEQAALSEHLAACPQCRVYATETQSLGADLSQLMHQRWDSARSNLQSTHVFQNRLRRTRMQTKVFTTLRIAAAGAVVLALIAAIQWVNRNQTLQPLTASTNEPERTATPLPNELLSPPTLLPGATPTFTPTPSTRLGGNTLPMLNEAPGLIVFASMRDGNSEIYTMRPDGSQLTNVTQNPGHDFAPQWSPDGSKIAFVSERTGAANLFVMNADGTNLIQLTQLDQATVRYQPPFAWSPDNKTIAAIHVSVSREGAVLSASLHVISVEDGTLTAQYDSQSTLVWPRWSASGQYVAVANADYTATIMTMADGQMMPSANMPCVGAFDWSPVADQLTCITQDYNLVSYNADGTLADSLWQFDAASAPALVDWSPDGSMLVLSAYQESAQRSQLYVFNAAARDVRLLDTSPVMTENSVMRGIPLVSWSPDSKWLVFEYSPTSTTRSGGVGVVSVQAQGGALDLSSQQKGMDSMPQWQPNP